MQAHLVSRAALSSDTRHKNGQITNDCSHLCQLVGIRRPNDESAIPKLGPLLRDHLGDPNEQRDSAGVEHLEVIATWV
jgi:hypothetical protein